MDILQDNLKRLAQRLVDERKRQGLTRQQAAAVCSVSPSFIRDAESDPTRCSFGKLLSLLQGLGLALAATGWSDELAVPVGSAEHLVDTGVVVGTKTK